MAKTRDNPEDIAVRKNLTPLDPTIPPKLRSRTVIDIKTPSGPTKRVTGRVSAEDTMNDIGMRKSAGTRREGVMPEVPMFRKGVMPEVPMFRKGVMPEVPMFRKGVMPEVPMVDGYDDAPNGNVEVGPITPMKKGGKVKAPKKFSRGGGIEVRGKTKGRFV